MGAIARRTSTRPRTVPPTREGACAAIVAALSTKTVTGLTADQIDTIEGYRAQIVGGEIEVPTVPEG